MFALLLAAVLVASSAAVDCDLSPNDTTPQAIHLALSGPSATSISISFFTCFSPENKEPTATLTGGELYTGTTSKTHARYHHDILITELSPDTVYEYSVALGEHRE